METKSYAVTCNMIYVHKLYCNAPICYMYYNLSKQVTKVSHNSVYKILKNAD